jgi:hypothetical protein
MDSHWIFYLSTLVGTTAVLFWVFLPTPVFRAAKSWVRTAGPEKYRHWIRYSTIKRSLTPHAIAMNAIHDSSFSKNDLEKLNELFAKLEQPPAKLIDPQTGDPFVSREMKHTGDEFNPKRGELYVLDLRSNGVAWRDEVLKKANVTKCTSDRLLMRNLAMRKTAGKKLAESFLDFLQQDGEFKPDFELSSSKVQGFIDTRISESQADGLLSSLMESDPDGDLSLIRPAPDQQYDDDTMIAAGDQPGHRCKVVDVIHPGLKRKSDRAWRVKALVTIQNLSRNKA